MGKAIKKDEELDNDSAVKEPEQVEGEMPNA